MYQKAPPSKSVFVIPLYMAPHKPKDGPFGQLPELSPGEARIAGRGRQYAMDIIQLAADREPNSALSGKITAMYYPVRYSAASLVGLALAGASADKHLPCVGDS